MKELTEQHSNVRRKLIKKKLQNNCETISLNYLFVKYLLKNTYFTIYQKIVI